MSPAPSALQQCVLLAGGLGTRLGGLTRETPKPMLPVAGRPFLEHLMAKARRAGFASVLVLAGYRAEVIARWIAAEDLGARLGLKIEVIVEPEPLGTAGALAFAGERLSETFVLANADTWFDFDWADLAARAEHPWTMALRRVDPADRYETVQLTEGRVDRILPRDGRATPGLINGGAYRGRRDMCPARVRPASLEAELLPRWAVEGRLGGQVYAGDFIDIGVPEAYDAAQALLSRE